MGATLAQVVREGLAKARDPKAYVADEAKAEVRICAGSACHASGRPAVTAAFKEELASHGLVSSVRLVETGCHGFCEQGPIVVLWPGGILYPRVRPDDVARIVEASIVHDGVYTKRLYKDPNTKQPIAHAKDIPFYSEQQRRVLALNGKIDPCSIDDYLARGGYGALARVLVEDDPGGVVEVIEESGLRGRGGAGFTTGTKWRLTRDAPGTVKYVICNADEGDPGAFMDRSVLEGNPHAVVEGMLIAAFVIGAGEGYVYVRYEYQFAVERVRRALAQARERGLLGADILGSGFAFDIRISEGAGAFVCGEETALMASIEGRRGMPRTRPPYPAVEGLFGKPTNINNVETYANVPWIINNGAAAFAATGTATSKGTKIFSLTGNVANGGLVEVPVGVTLRHVIFDIGGGMLPSRHFKAVQLGGPSGGCLPEALLDEPIDFESLAAAGSMMGSGGMVVVDDSTCMVDFARFFLRFTAEESCGKCVPCRVGTGHLVSILDAICTGRGQLADLDRLERLARLVKASSLCGLGQTAPNPVLSSMKYFRDEFLEHITAKRCRAVVCRDLVVYRIIPNKCTGCQRCVQACPTGAITGPRAEAHSLDPDKCIKCRSCYEVCHFGAIAGDAVAGEAVAGDAIVIESGGQRER
jgi:NADH:ubiquinone oxidoreductase subunit F (NADH-binding)/(2Fe-2S) ferredoxin/NAD-dependent dihydropyrimidine dehydrogenase PreA subunit